MTIDVSVTYLEHQDELIEWLQEDKEFFILTKGRRYGFTHFAAHFIIDVLAIEKQVPFILWGDTVNGNIDRYVERYFMPLLKQIPSKYWKWKQQLKQLTILNTTIDFRSSDNPQRWEGFGYDWIFLNEAGIILQNRSLWENTITPMRWDNPNCKVVAAGVPKGIRGKKVEDNQTGEHVFYELYKRAKDGEEGFTLKEKTTYDNTTLSKEVLQKEEGRWDKLMIDQEMYGKFISRTGLLWAYAFNDTHKAPVKDDEVGTIYVSLDFNINPYTALIAQEIEKDGKRTIHFIDEIYMKAASIDNNKSYTENICDRIKAKYGDRYLLVTGDATQKKGNVDLPVNMTTWHKIIQFLEINQYTQLNLPKSNPFVDNSRDQVNGMLSHPEQVEILINPDMCPELISDLEECKADEGGGIIKKEGWRSHMLDNFRYHLNTYHYWWYQDN